MSALIFQYIKISLQYVKNIIFEDWGVWNTFAAQIKIIWEKQKENKIIRQIEGWILSHLELKWTQSR